MLAKWSLLAALALSCAPAAAPDQPAPEPLRRPPPVTHEQLMAMRSVPVTMYMTSWCPYCAKARSWLRRGGYTFEERNIELDEQALAILEEINPTGSVPTFDVDGYIVRGFRPYALTIAMQRVVMRGE